MRGSVKGLPSVLFFLIVLGISLPAAAQDNVPMIDVSGGYNYLRGKVPHEEHGGVKESVTYSNGWYIDLGINTPKPRKMLAIAGQVNMSRKKIEGEEANIRGYMGGVRLNFRNNPNAVPYIQFIAGGTNSKFGNAGDGFDEWTVFYTWQLGAGVNIMVTPKAGLRVAADFQRIQGKVDSTILKDNFNMMRVAAGIVLPFGTR